MLVGSEGNQGDWDRMKLVGRRHGGWVRNVAGNSGKENVGSMNVRIEATKLRLPSLTKSRLNRFLGLEGTC